MHQPNVQFLPISIHENFPDLKTYVVVNTLIQKISSKNFEKLYKLEKLIIENNQLEMVRSDTFEDLFSLKELQISNEQRLTALNDQAFTNLQKLQVFDFSSNFCINRKFTAGVYKKFPDMVSESCGFKEFDSVEVACEQYKGFVWYGLLTVFSCFMDKTTAINGKNFIIADLKDEEVEGIVFHSNRLVEYLPYKVHLQPPNLSTYRAAFCSIKEISKENFENLNRLKHIDLNYNRIEKIAGNTFNGLRSLKKVELSSNKIKSINGRTFDQLPLLISVDLRENQCINKQLEEGQSIVNFTRKIIQQCSFTETGEREFEKVFDIECGVGLKGSGYIVGGKETKRGQWPFMAALMLQSESQFFCGGNIITASHVLTAAHCIQNKYKENPFEASQIAILLGRYNISLRAEIGSEIRGVKEIKVHPRWNPSDLKFEGDIAVLEMDRVVQFSELIQPVCLTVEPEISAQEAGYVVGWGKSEELTLHATVPRQALISSVIGDVCFAKDYKLGSMFAQGMFCAGGDGVGPCNGDSGGGFFVRYHGLWTLRGVVSSGTSKTDGGCDVGRYSLFTTVLDYTSWIKDLVKNYVPPTRIGDQRKRKE